MKPKLLPLLEMVVETGVRRGLARARKHNDAPSDEQIADAVERAIWDEMHEWFDFEEIDR